MLELPLKINPVLNLPLLNTQVAAIKKALGPLGEGIELIDPDEFEAAISAIENEAESLLGSLGDLGDEVDELGDKLGNVEKNGGGLGKMFQANQASQFFREITQGISELSQPFVALDTATAQLRTLGDEAAAMAPNLREAAIQMSKDLPFAAADLQTAMFDALASGVKGGESGLKSFADTAAKLATGGGSQLGDATNLLAGQLNAYGASADQAGRYADIFFNTVNYGVTSVSDLSSGLSQVVPTAASAGIEIENVGASVAVLTSKGIPSAQSMTALNAMLIELQKPGGTLAPILQKAGVSMESLKRDDLPVTLGKIQGALQATGKTATQAFSSSEASKAFNVLTSDLEGFQQTFIDVRDTTGSAQNAYTQMSGSVEVQTAQMKSQLEAFLIEGLDHLGTGFVTAANASTQLAPIVTTFTGLKAAVPSELIGKFGSSIKDVVLPALVKLGVVRATGIAATTAETAAAGANAAAKGVQAVATGGATTAQYALNTAMLSNPIFLLVAGVAAAVAAFAIFGDSTKELGDATNDAADAVKSFDDTAKGAEFAKKQKGELTALADEYEKLRSSTDPKEQERFAEVANKLAQAVPSAADAVDKLDASGKKIGETYQISTADVRAFADEQARMAAEAQDDALGALDDQAQGLADSMHEAQGNIKELRKERDELAASGSTDDLKETRKELVTQRQELQKAEEQARAVVASYAKMGLSVDKIAERTGFTTEEVKKYGGALGDAAAKADQAQQGTDGLAEAAKRAQTNASDLATAYKAVKDASEAAYSSTFNATRELQEEQRRNQRELADLNKLDVATLTEQQRQRKVFLEQRLKDLPQEIQREIAAARDALKERRRLEREETILKLQVGEINVNIDDLRRQAQDVKNEVDKILFGIASTNVGDEIETAFARIDNDLAASKQKVVRQIEDLDKKLQAAKGDPTKEVRGGAELRRQLNRQLEALDKQAAQAKTDAEKEIRAKQLEQFRKLLAEQQKGLAEHAKNQIEILKAEEEAISGNTDEALSARLEKRRQQLNLQQQIEIDAVVTSNDDYIKAYGDVQLSLLSMSEATTDEERAQAQQRVADAIDALGEVRQTVLDGNTQIAAIRKKGAIELGKSEKEIRDVQYDREEKELERQLARRQRTYERAAATQKEILDSVTEFARNIGVSAIDEETAKRLKNLEQMHEEQRISDEKFESEQTRIKEEGERQRAALEARLRGKQLEEERVASLMRLEVTRQELEKKKALAESFGQTEKAAELGQQLDDIQLEIQDKGETLTTVVDEMKGNLSGIFDGLFAGDEEKVKEGFRGPLQALAGGLQALASAKVTEVLLSAIGPTGLPGLLASFLLRPLVESIINAAMSPVLNSILSFASTGRVDSPTLAIVGDAARMGGTNREWINNDDQLRQIVAMGAAQSSAVVVRALEALGIELRAFSGRIYVTQREVAEGADKYRTRRARRVLGKTVPT